MSLANLIRKNVKTVDRVVDSLKVPITFTPWVGQNEYGTEQFGSSITLRAVVEQKQDSKELSSGEIIRTIASITLTRPVAPNGASGRNEPIDRRDVITLPDGTTGPIVDIETVLDPSTGRGYYHQVWLGRK